MSKSTSEIGTKQKTRSVEEEMVLPDEELSGDGSIVELPTFGRHVVELTEDVLTRLSAPFPEEDIRERPQQFSADKQRVLMVSYVDKFAVIRRLNEVLGFGTYSIETEYCSPTCVRTAIVVHTPDGDRRFEDYGESHSDHLENVKSAATDGIRRAAVLLGVGAYLYQRKLVWKPVSDTQNSSSTADGGFPESSFLGALAVRLGIDPKTTNLNEIRSLLDTLTGAPPTVKQLSYLNRIGSPQLLDEIEDMQEFTFRNVSGIIDKLVSRQQT